MRTMFNWRQHGAWLLVGAVVLFGAWTATERQRRLDTARVALDSALASSASWQRAADSAVFVAGAWQAAANVARDAATREASRALRAERSLETAMSLFDEAVLNAPDTCAPVIAAAERALAASDSATQSWRAAFTASDQRASALQFALDTTSGALAGARVEMARLARAAVAVSVASKPSFWERLRPKPGIGLAAGVDATGRPAIIAGVTLGWTR